MLEKSKLAGRAGAPGLLLVDDAFRKKYPVTWDYLTQSQWEDGTPREQSSLGIYPEHGVIRVMLRDKAMGVCCWVAIPDLTSLWPTLEAALCDPKHEWRADRMNGGPAKRVGRHGQRLDNGHR